MSEGYFDDHTLVDLAERLRETEDSLDVAKRYAAKVPDLEASLEALRAMMIKRLQAETPEPPQSTQSPQDEPELSEDEAEAIESFHPLDVPVEERAATMTVAHSISSMANGSTD